ncbi:hypothetical protein FNF29_05487 [Cafeteria roenbergensis]|uniref:N-acetylgalactosaminide beta-1,3-galactosyltransferase n=1 Tax=Cafeteria roenbergensis TaxID=33653 RepID=A0A5A8CAA3_CAFRO|nr:hypothetical protein FNF29_05487 [Cafeteria roenbergensis]|eukprot:KAA0150046.1 hypothetical protein FNF29_05487 [Cafeteria roenbergensis]
MPSRDSRLLVGIQVTSSPSVLAVGVDLLAPWVNDLVVIDTPRSYDGTLRPSGDVLGRLAEQQMRKRNVRYMVASVPEGCALQEGGCEAAHAQATLELAGSAMGAADHDLFVLMRSDQLVDGRVLDAAAGANKRAVLVLRRFVHSIRWRPVDGAEQTSTAAVLPWAELQRLGAAAAAAHAQQVAGPRHTGAGGAPLPVGALPREEAGCSSLQGWDADAPLRGAVTVLGAGIQLLLAGSLFELRASAQIYFAQAWNELPARSATALAVRALEDGVDLLRCTTSQFGDARADDAACGPGAGCGSGAPPRRQVLVADDCGRLRRTLSVDFEGGLPVNFGRSVADRLMALNDEVRTAWASVAAPGTTAAAPQRLLPGHSDLLDGGPCSGRAVYQLGLDPSDIVIAIVTSSGAHDRLWEAQTTWIPRARDLGISIVYISDTDDPFIPTMSCPNCTADKFGLKWKTRFSFLHMLEAFPHAKWLFRAMDDTYVAVDNLVFHLAQLDPSERVYLGDPYYYARDGSVQVLPIMQKPFPFTHPSYPVEAYPGGGCGWILSRPAAEFAMERVAVYDRLITANEIFDDVFWGMFMNDIGLPMEPASCLTQSALLPSHARLGLEACRIPPAFPPRPQTMVDPYPSMYRPCAIHMVRFGGTMAAVHDDVESVCSDFGIHSLESTAFEMCDAWAVEYR